jgi:tRNA(Ile)-lysidine synthase TilS/MesJ
MDKNTCGESSETGKVRLKNGPCDKCGQRSFTSSRSRLLCKSCFAESVEHQFRKALQVVKPSRNIHGHTRLLVGFSGGLSSWALLDLCEKLLKQDARKVQFELHAVWVDCLDVLPCSDAAATRAQITDVIASAKLFRSFRRIPLCAAFSPSLDPSDSERVALDAKLVRLFSGSRRAEVTWKEDLMDVLVRAILLRAAQSCRSSRVVTGESMTRCCVKLLTGMARGIGVNAASTVGCVDPLTFGHLDMMLSRPLVGLTSKEIALYLRAVNRPILQTVPSFSTLATDKKNSVSLLSATFLLSLQEAHDHTLPTLIRSAQKLEDSSSNTVYCREWAECMGCDPELKKRILQRGETGKVSRCSVCLLVAPLELESDKDCCNDQCDCSKARLCRVCQLLTENMSLNNGEKTNYSFFLFELLNFNRKYCC